MRFSTLGIVLFAAACATNPATGRREFTLMSEAQEIALAQNSERTRLAIMNGHDVNTPPRAGERLKIVVGG